MIKKKVLQLENKITYNDLMNAKTITEITTNNKKNKMPIIKYFAIFVIVVVIIFCSIFSFK